MKSGKGTATKKKPIAKEKVSPKSTPIKTRPKTGRGAMNGKETGKCFTKENQPSFEARSKGQQKRFRGQELARMMLNCRYIPTNDDNGIREVVAGSLGIAPEDVTIEQVITFRQMQKAITQQDTVAYNAVSNRAFGFPKEYHEILDVEVKTEEQITASKVKKIRAMLHEKF